MRVANLYSPQTNTQLSLRLTVAVKIRVLAEFFFRTQLLGRKHRRNLKRTQLFGLSKLHSQALVLANGPSLGKLDISKVTALQKAKEIEVFGVNFFPLGELATNIELDFLTLSDPFTRPLSQSLDTQRLWRYIKNHERLKLICPVGWLDDFEKTPISNDIYYFDDRSLEGWSKNVSPIRPRGYTSLTALKALAFAAHLGYSSIYVLGLDNDMFRAVSVDKCNTVTEGNWHSTGTDAGRGRGVQDLPNGIGDYFYGVSKTFLDLRLFSKYNQITNMDSASLVDAFPKPATQEQEWLIIKKS